MTIFVRSKKRRHRSSRRLRLNDARVSAALLTIHLATRKEAAVATVLAMEGPALEEEPVPEEVLARGTVLAAVVRVRETGLAARRRVPADFSDIWTVQPGLNKSRRFGKKTNYSFR